MFRFFATSATALALMLLSVGASIASASVPQVSTDVSLGGTSYPDTGSGTYHYSTSTYGDDMTAVVQLAPGPFISIDASKCCSISTSSGARVELIYYATLSGPNLGPVPMELFENLSSVATGPDAGGWAMITATGATSGQEILNSSSGSSDTDSVNPGGSIPGILRFDATPGQDITIDMAVNAYLVVGSTSSSADPFLTIDPSFAAIDPTYSTDYSLAFSSGIVNAPADVSGVPEPSTWAMMLFGFGGVGFAMRRNRRRLETRPAYGARMFKAGASVAAGMLLSMGSASQAQQLQMQAGGQYAIDNQHEATQIQISSPGTYITPHQSVSINARTTNVQASAGVSGYGGDFFPSGNLSYQYMVSGEPNAMVPVSIAFNMFTSADGYDARAIADISTLLYDNNGNPLPTADWYALSCTTTGQNSCPGDTIGSGGVAGSFSGFVRSNTPIWITLDAEAVADSIDSPLASSATAWADPRITVLDPNFTLQLPDGVGNLTGLAGSVPEPSTWALILLGFGGIGLAMRRRSAAAGRLSI